MINNHSRIRNLVVCKVLRSNESAHNEIDFQTRITKDAKKFIDIALYYQTLVQLVHSSLALVLISVSLLSDDHFAAYTVN